MESWYLKSITDFSNPPLVNVWIPSTVPWTDATMSWGQQQPQGRQYLCWPDGADISSITDLASMSVEGFPLNTSVSLGLWLFSLSPVQFSFPHQHLPLWSAQLQTLRPLSSLPTAERAEMALSHTPNLVTSVLWNSQRRLLANRTPQLRVPASRAGPTCLSSSVPPYFEPPTLSEFSVLAFSAESAHDFVLPSPCPTLPPDMTYSIHPLDPAGDAGVLVPWASENLCTCLASPHLFSSVLALCIMTSWFHAVCLMALLSLSPASGIVKPHSLCLRIQFLMKNTFLFLCWNPLM